MKCLKVQKLPEYKQRSSKLCPTRSETFNTTFYNHLSGYFILISKVDLRKMRFLNRLPKFHVLWFNAAHAYLIREVAEA
jgi:hypothetical protein